MTRVKFKRVAAEEYGLRSLSRDGWAEELELRQLGKASFDPSKS
jgi:hypothetical protein